jgi:hypothetical protein
MFSAWLGHFSLLAGLIVSVPILSAVFFLGFSPRGLVVPRPYR